VVRALLSRQPRGSRRSARRDTAFSPLATRLATVPTRRTERRWEANKPLGCLPLCAAMRRRTSRCAVFGSADLET